MRSMLFVPADSERKIEKALASDADALILDLEDSVVDANKDQARRRVAELLGRSSKDIYVRVGSILEDLAAVVKPGLSGIILPKVSSVEDIFRAAHYLDALEVPAGVSGVQILPIVPETAEAVFQMRGYSRKKVRVWRR